MSSLKRLAKNTALELVGSRYSPDPDALSRLAMRLLRIGLEPGLDSGYGAGTRAACCISVDFDVTREERYPWNREGTRALLASSARHGIPITWAMCGKTVEEDRASYQSILSSSVEQEIGVHTYSHIYADETPESAYEEDIRKCISTLGLSSPPKTFVFPKNREGHFDLLRRLGFISFRGAKRAIGAPARRGGMWNIRPVYYVDGKSLRSEALVKRFIDACISRSAVFHLWTHPWSLAIDGDVQLMEKGFLDPVFAYLEDKGRTGELSLTTMGGLARFLSGQLGPFDEGQTA